LLINRPDFQYILIFFIYTLMSNDEKVLPKWILTISAWTYFDLGLRTIFSRFLLAFLTYELSANLSYELK